MNDLSPKVILLQISGAKVGKLASSGIYIFPLQIQYFPAGVVTPHRSSERFFNPRNWSPTGISGGWNYFPRIDFEVKMQGNSPEATWEKQENAGDAVGFQWFVTTCGKLISIVFISKYIRFIGCFNVKTHFFLLNMSLYDFLCVFTCGWSWVPFVYVLLVWWAG